MNVSGVTGYILKEDSDTVTHRGYSIELTYDSLTLVGRMQQRKTLLFLTKAEIITAPFKFINFEGHEALDAAKEYIDEQLQIDQLEVQS